MSKRRTKLKNAKLLEKKLRDEKPSHDHDKASSKCSVTGEIKVNGTVEVHGTENSAKEHRTERTEDNSHKNQTHAYESSSLLVAKIAAFISAAYFIATVCILLETRHATKIAQITLDKTIENFQAEQRPYIGILKFETLSFDTKNPGPLQKGQPAVFNIPYKNVGKSTALNVILHRHVLFESQLPEFRIEPMAKDDLGSTVMDPGDELHTNAVSVKNTFSIETAGIPESQLANWDGSEKILVFGRISYEDNFSNLYCTPFSVAYVSGIIVTNTVIEGHRMRELCPSGKR
jgi:hypothetical protein